MRGIASQGGEVDNNNELLREQGDTQRKYQKKGSGKSEGYGEDSFEVHGDEQYT